MKNCRQGLSLLAIDLQHVDFLGLFVSFCYYCYFWWNSIGNTSWTSDTCLSYFSHTLQTTWKWWCKVKVYLCVGFPHQLVRGVPIRVCVSGSPPSPSGCVCVSHQFVWAVLPATITCSHQICLENLTALHPTAHCHRARGWGVRACSSWLCNRHHYLSDLREVSRSLFSPPDPHRWDSAPLGDLLQYFSEFGNTPRDLLL